MSPRSLSKLLGLAVVGAGVGYLGSARTAEFPNAPVILISIDTLRSDHLPMYGYLHGSTPHLDAFRRDAILFERAYSHYPLTLPSHCSVLTGQLPSEHGVRDNTGYVLASDLPYLPQLLQELRSFWAPLVAPSELSRVPKALAALGYLSTPRRDIGGDRPDPRRRLATIAQLQKARTLDAAGHDEAAAHQFEELLAGEPNLPDAWSSYAEVLVRLDRREAAITAYRKAIESSGFVPHLIARLSMLVLESGRPEEAWAILQASADAGESPEVIVRQMAAVLTARGRFAEAISTLGPLVARGDLESRWLLAQAYNRAGRHEEARTTLGAVLAVAPDHERALALLAELERRLL